MFPKVGDHVHYVDEHSVVHDALLTAVWGTPGASVWPQPCVNVLYVSKDEARQDQYGRQIERPSSVSHMSTTTAHGRYWKWPDEETRSVEAHSV